MKTAMHRTRNDHNAVRLKDGQDLLLNRKVDLSVCLNDSAGLQNRSGV